MGLVGLSFGMLSYVPKSDRLEMSPELPLNLDIGNYNAFSID
jgi:hypothetical protein